ncbi:hypothetical protein SEA_CHISANAKITSUNE_11 [Gordonia phage ChisanaKitsune]|uniref:Acb2/Tad1 hairpin domain-containing protein n=1 Tax=Gordonia phage ChisanaKitsune TaxID=2871538 RepID=A0AAE7XG99_9CAUD|nr:hypothetical protein PQD15_gp011 [Gordonia phage ChisanaKitsune]QZE10784.1 hypothetical protein SEA_CHISANAKITSUNE_11 [Gordonia phage ChisanaKitsune]
MAEEWDHASQMQRFTEPPNTAVSTWEIREAFCDLAELLMDRLPKNREAFVAMNNLETACLYAVKAAQA